MKLRKQKKGEKKKKKKKKQNKKTQYLKNTQNKLGLYGCHMLVVSS